MEDADEPPVFVAPSYTFEVEENAPAGTQVGRVHAKDTDIDNNPVRYDNIEMSLLFESSPDGTSKFVNTCMQVHDSTVHGRGAVLQCQLGGWHDHHHQTAGSRDSGLAQYFCVGH